MICPKCEHEDEMQELMQYESETGKMEVTMECVNPECPVRFYGILYQGTKAVEESQ